MTTKILTGLGGVILGFLIGYAFLHHSATPAPSATMISLQPQTSTSSSDSTANATQPTATQASQSSSKPTFTIGTPVTKVVQSAPSVSFDSPSFTSTTAYPTLTGTATIPKISIVIYNSKGVGIVGTSEIPVVNGHWSYNVSISLAPGMYTAKLPVSGEATKSATLVVSY